MTAGLSRGMKLGPYEVLEKIGAQTLPHDQGG